jgi:hypothetical protein
MEGIYGKSYNLPAHGGTGFQPVPAQAEVFGYPKSPIALININLSSKRQFSFVVLCRMSVIHSPAAQSSGEAELRKQVRSQAGAWEREGGEGSSFHRAGRARRILTTDYWQRYRHPSGHPWMGKGRPGGPPFGLSYFKAVPHGPGTHP